MTDIDYDSLKAWVGELGERREQGHELLWADMPKVSRQGRGFSREHSCYGFWDLTDDTYHIIPAPVVIEGFKELPYMRDVLRPKWMSWAIKDIDRHSEIKERFLKEGAHFLPPGGYPTPKPPTKRPWLRTILSKCLDIIQPGA